MGRSGTGECVCKAFAYILNEDDLEEALNWTGAYQLLADGVELPEVNEVKPARAIPSLRDQ